MANASSCPSSVRWQRSRQAPERLGDEEKSGALSSKQPKHTHKVALCVYRSVNGAMHISYSFLVAYKQEIDGKRGHKGQGGWGCGFFEADAEHHAHLSLSTSVRREGEIIGKQGEKKEGPCRRCDQRHPGRRCHELPKAPWSFLAHLSALPDAHLGRDSGPASDGHAPHFTCMCLKTTFSGSTKLANLQLS